jgi:hypothetical protein
LSHSVFDKEFFFPRYFFIMPWFGIKLRTALRFTIVPHHISSPHFILFKSSCPVLI